MTLFGRRCSLLESAAVVTTLFALTFSSTLAYGRVTSRQCGRPGFTVLGAGGSLSVLVTDGRARLLLATGDDPAGFGNALGDSRWWGCKRIDVLLLAGSTSDVTFLNRARRVAMARHVEVIGRADLLGALGLPADSSLQSPRRFQLSAETSVTIETVDRPDSEEGPSFGWQALIEHGETRVAVISDGQLAGAFVDRGPIAALVVGGSDATAALEEVVTRVFVASATENTGPDVREAVAATAREQSWIVRVFPGESRRFDFEDRGLAVPDSAVAVSASPAATSEAR